MCGIIAALGPPVSEDRWRAALASLAHRGPDGEGSFQSPCRQARLGHRRLAIIDIAHGQQPLANEDGSIHLVMNGELYDAPAIREQLIARGHRFATRSDSEILLHLYEDHGLGCLEHLRGEFAFVLWDQRERHLFAARDRFGIKPLCMHRAGPRLLLASEAKAFFALGIQPRWDPHTLQHVFAHQYPLPGQSLFAGVETLPPGHFLLAKPGQVRIERYWDIPQAPPITLSPTEAQARFSALLQDAIGQRLRSEAPLAVYLSGGIDSATILAHGSRIAGRGLPCFSVAFEVPAYDESGLAAQIAQHCQAPFTPVRVGQEALMEHLEAAVWQGECLAINGQLPAKHILSQAVQQAGFKVVLSGEGADEALFGYPHLKQEWIRSLDPASQARQRTRLQAENQLSRGVMLPTGRGSGGLPIFLQAKAEFGRVIRAWMTDEARQATLAADPLARLMAHFAPDLPPCPIAAAAYLWTRLALAKYILRGIGDGMEMSHGIEGRPPFLDRALFSFCSRLPVELKIHDGREKHILREAMRGLLPDWLIARPKHPFLAPPISLFGSPRGDALLQGVLRSNLLAGLPHIDPKRVRAFLDRLPRLDRDRRARAEPPLMLLLSACLIQQKMNAHRAG